MMKRRAEGLALAAAVTGGSLLLLSQGLAAQLTVDPPGQRLRAGDTVVVVLPPADGRGDAPIEALLFDDQPVPFEVLAPRPGDGAVRLRFRVPATARPGNHEIAVLFPRRARVPEIVGLPLDEARGLLAAEGLELDLGAFLPRDLEGVEESVAGQRPAAGSPARPGSRVTVEVASASAVPDLRGLGLDEAERRLAALGLELDAPLVAVAGPERSLAWSVLDHEPPPGAMAPTGSTVTVETAVEVPDVVGRPLAEVVGLLRGLGLRVDPRVRDPALGPYETIFEQDPAPGLLVVPGTGVAVVFESLPEPVPRWPWPWLALTVLLAALLLQQVRARWLPGRGYRIEPHLDLDGLRGGTEPPRWTEEVPAFELRLRARPDPGRQTLATDGALLSTEAPRP